MKIAAKLSMYHGPIYKWLLENGLSQKSAAKKIGIAYGTLNRIVTLQWIPNENIAQRISIATGIPVDDVIQEGVLDKDSRRQVRFLEVEHRALAHYADQHRARVLEWSQTEKTDFNEVVQKSLSAMEQKCPRMVKIVKWRMDGLTYDEISERLGVCKEWVRQIERSAHRFMGHALKKLVPITERNDAFGFLCEERLR